MSRTITLIRPCLGLVTRIECEIKPLGQEQSLWTLLCAAGLNGQQPTAIKAQGPFHGPKAAEGVMTAIAENLVEQGYIQVEETQIWRLHMQSELRKMNGERAHQQVRFQVGPDA